MSIPIATRVTEKEAKLLDELIKKGHALSRSDLLRTLLRDYIRIHYKELDNSLVAT